MWRALTTTGGVNILVNFAHVAKVESAGEGGDRVNIYFSNGDAVVVRAEFTQVKSWVLEAR